MLLLFSLPILAAEPARTMTKISSNRSVSTGPTLVTKQNPTSLRQERRNKTHIATKALRDNKRIRSNFPDPKKQRQVKRPGTYRWHFDITATYFYVGQLPTPNNPTPNTASSWDSDWTENFGGLDHPDREMRCPVRFIPKKFTPSLNPFYVALPYNDIQKGGPKPEALKVIPWYKRDKRDKYSSVCQGMWVQIYYQGRYCFAQWEDCGPFVTDDWKYVFLGSRPKNSTKNKGAAIDLSPAVRDYLGIPGGMATLHWRFVEFPLVPTGPWARYGKDNPFLNPNLPKAKLKQKYIRLLKQKKR